MLHRLLYSAVMCCSFCCTRQSLTRTHVSYDHNITNTRCSLENQSLMSHQTHYRSYQGQFLQVIWPNQQCQSTEGNQLVLQIRPESHQHHSTILQ